MAAARIPYGRQWITDDDVQAVTEVLRGDWLTTGPAVARFEADLVAVTGARHAVAFSSATAGLHAAAAAAGLGPGRLLATSPLSFVASANCARFVGADVTFVDIDPATLNLDLSAVPSCDALIPVHYAGLPVDLTVLIERPPVVIEDAAHALGATTPDGPVGSCARSDMCVFSFHPVKTITTGEGGAVTTNDDELAAALRRFRNHGTVPRPDLGGWAYDVVGLGFNYRLTDLQAALGSSQLARLDEFVTRRNELAERYRDLLRDLPVVLPPAAPTGWRHAYHLFPVQVPNRRSVYDHLHANGIAAQVHYVPIYRHSAFADHNPAAYPATEAAYEGLLSLPLYPLLSDADQDRVMELLHDALLAAA